MVGGTDIRVKGIEHGRHHSLHQKHSHTEIFGPCIETGESSVCLALKVLDGL